MTEQEPASALIVERIQAAEANVVTPDPGEPQLVELHLQVGQLGPRLFITSKQTSFPPQLAIDVGRALVAAGMQAKSGLITATADQLPT